MKKNVSIRMFCMLLAVVLLFSVFSLTVVAVDDVALPEVAPSTEENVILPSESLITEQTTEETTFFVPGPGELSYAQLQTATLAAADIPEVIPLAKVEEKQHVNRLYAQETDLHTIKFQNRDGSKTDYIFKQPVKYIAEDGSVRDIGTQPVAGKYALRGKSYVYALTEHSMHQYFPAQIQNGVLVEVSGHYVEMVPQSTYIPLVVQMAKMQNNALLYEDVFGAGIDIRYTPVSSGLKEDIVLASYTGVHSFSFLFKTNGLFIEEIEGEYCLVNADGAICASLGKVLVYDSALHYTRGEMTVTALSAGNTYRVTLSVDEAFLRSPDTVYPVTVDPTIGETAYSYTQGTVNMIEDYGLYKDDMTDYTDEQHLLGWLEDTCIGRVVYKFPFFHTGGNALSVNYTQYSGGNIGSAKLNVYAGGIDTASVKIYPLTQNWSFSANAIENDTYWNQTLSTTHMVTGTLDAYNAYNTLDLTAIFRKWADYNAGNTSKPNPAYGLILVNDNETTTDNVWILNTTEYAQNNTYLELDTDSTAGTHYLHNGSTGKLARANRAGPPHAVCYNETDNFEWFFQYMGNGQYLITSQYGSSLCVNNSNQLVVGNVSSSNVTDAYLWKLVNPQMGGYTIKNVATDLVLYHTENATQMSVVTARATTAADCWNTIWDIKSAYTPLTDFSLPEEYYVFPYTGVSAAYQLWLNIVDGNGVWQNKHDFYWSVSDPTFYIASDYSSAGQLTVPANGGVTNVVIQHKTTGMQKSYRVVCGEFLEDTCYILENKATGRYMDIEGPTTANGAPLQQWDLHTGAQMQFKLKLVAANTYWIQSVHSGKYLSVVNASTASGATIHQNTETASLNAKWVITKTASGAYRLSPAHASNYAISVPSNANQNGADLVQRTYTNDTNYWDEWLFTRMLPLSGYEEEYQPELWNDLDYLNLSSEETWELEVFPNCYSYALNTQYYFFLKDGIWNMDVVRMQPGELAGDTYSVVTATEIVDSVQKDAAAASFVFVSVGKYDSCPEGTYKVALVIDAYNDYHWYRQDSNGFWSHKPGGTPVINTDASGDYIVDPEYADRAYPSSQVDYDEFVGYFAIRPIGLLYSVVHPEN